MKPKNEASLTIQYELKLVSPNRQEINAMLNDILAVAVKELPFLIRLVRYTKIEISVTFLTAKAMRNINHEHRSVDATTDVLSFPMLEVRSGRHLASLKSVMLGAEFDADLRPIISLGDILIDPKQALSQADLYGHSALHEIGFLFTHGLLHLCGYDHESKTRNLTMRRWQRTILEAANLREKVENIDESTTI